MHQEASVLPPILGEEPEGEPPSKSLWRARQKDAVRRAKEYLSEKEREVALALRRNPFIETTAEGKLRDPSSIRWIEHFLLHGRDPSVYVWSAAAEPEARRKQGVWCRRISYRYLARARTGRFSLRELRRLHPVSLSRKVYRELYRARRSLFSNSSLSSTFLAEAVLEDVEMCLVNDGILLVQRYGELPTEQMATLSLARHHGLPFCLAQKITRVANGSLPSKGLQKEFDILAHEIGYRPHIGTVACPQPAVSSSLASLSQEMLQTKILPPSLIGSLSSDVGWEPAPNDESIPIDERKIKMDRRWRTRLNPLAQVSGTQFTSFSRRWLQPVARPHDIARRKHVWEEALKFQADQRVLSETMKPSYRKFLFASQKCMNDTRQSVQPPAQFDRVVLSRRQLITHYWNQVLKVQHQAHQWYQKSVFTWRMRTQGVSVHA